MGQSYMCLYDDPVIKKLKITCLPDGNIYVMQHL